MSAMGPLQRSYKDGAYQSQAPCADTIPHHPTPAPPRPAPGRVEVRVGARGIENFYSPVVTMFCEGGPLEVRVGECLGVR